MGLTCSIVRFSPKTIFSGVLFTLSISVSQKSNISKLSPFSDIEKDGSLFCFDVLVKFVIKFDANKIKINVIKTRHTFFVSLLLNPNFGRIINLN